MTELEKVANGLRHCLHYNGSCLDCPYDGPNCQNDVLDDTLAWLKEQEPVEPEVEVLNEVDRIYRCPKCHKCLFYEKQKFCDQCGQAVKWDA